MKRFFLLLALCPLLFTATARAQYELKAGNFNSIFVAQTQAGGAATPSGPPVVASPPPTASQFSGMGQVAGSAGPISTSATLADRFPSNPGNTLVLVRATFGGVFAAGVPRYFMGDEIMPPLVQADGVTPAAADYWRAKPVLPGESFTPLALPVTVLTSSTGSPTVTVSSVPASLVTGSTLLGQTVNSIVSTTITLAGNANQTISAATIVSYVPPGAQTLLPLGTVNVLSSASSGADNTTVIVASTPPELVVGASLLGQPITRITGTTVTLAGPANTTITSSTPASITPATTFYYSVHAEKTYASQPGRVAITWVTRVPNGSGNYEIKAEDFAVSSNTSRTVRTIFWTEGSFDGPKVQITDARIVTVNPAFYSLVPKAVAEEVVIPGYVPLTPNLSTLTFDRYNGIGNLKAYNVEGRVVIEYLGDVRLAGVIHDSVGIDVVDIKRVADVSYPVVHLGDELTPHDGDPALIASPVLGTSQTGSTFYGTVVRPDNTNAYYAERETSAANDPDDGFPASADAYNKVVFYWMQTGDFGIQWPKFQDRYWQRWSPNLADYAHYTVDAAGSTPATGIAFTGGAVPQLVYQDDPAQTEAKIDLATQRLFVDLSASTDGRNRSLLKFTSSGKVWYVNLYTQAENRSTTRVVDANGTSTVTLLPGETAGLEVGMIVTGSGISGFATILAINGNTITLSQNVSTDTTYTFTVQSDADAPINTTATVGTRIDPPAGHEVAGQISGGACYYPAGYLNPFVVGAEAANLGAIIPVNALSTDNLLTVRWFRKVPAPTADFQDFYVPGKLGRYTVSYPAPAAGDAAAHITIAGGVGTDDLAEPERSGAIYYQNDSAQPGFNPNEEHALMLGGRAYALRDDLNTATTSQAFVLVAYTAADDRPAMKVWKVRRIYDQNGNSIKDSGDIMFDYEATAGTLLVKPYPLPLLPLPLVGTGVNRTSKDIEIAGADNPTNGTVSGDAAYTSFTFKDRKGFTWVHRGAHGGGSGTLTMKLYYLSQAGFFVPGIGEAAVGTVLPFLRNAARTGATLNINDIDNGEADQPLPVIYRPTWPTNAPSLRVAETLTLPKFGLPQVRGQASAQVLYQQSIAVASTGTGLTKNSVTLHDPTREKIVALDASTVGLEAVPAAIRTSSYQGRTYFQGLAPSLQERIFIDPLRGAKGTLVLLGEFHDEASGEDYLDLNLLTAAEETALKDLVPAGNVDETKWDAAIDALNTAVETFVPDPAQFGSYLVGSTANVGENDLAVISAPDTAVDSYAITATGQGAGFVTMVFGNGRAFTPDGDPVQVKVFKVAPDLYTGDLKVVSSANPLDEQTTLRHSADFAGKPEDYEFEWRWATGEASAPATYSNVMTKRVGDPTATPTPTHNWIVVRDPGAMVPTAAQITAAGAALPFPRSENVRPVNYVLDAQGQPTSTVIEATSYTDAEMALGYPSIFARSSVGVDFTTGVPGTIVFSADLGALDGCVLYVNGQPVLAHNAPETFFTNTDATTGLTQNGLSRQFSIAPSYFTAGANTIEVAIYTQADPNVQSTLNFMLEAAQETDLVTSGTVWQVPSGQVTNTTYPYGANVTIGGSTTNLPFGGPTFVLNDRWFTLRYRPKASANNVLGTPWSRWMPPQFVEGWIKRVLAAINPFEQRVDDLFNNAINTDVSVLTQAGTRWEGDVALTLDNINDVGLIAIYETVLNRARSMSIDANTNDPNTNNALLLAAGYLSDLYTILGNEAYADAANSTISLDDQATVTEVSTSRFSFEGQVASAVDEELALLKGRDDFVSPGVISAPFYNRLVWNYTHGINGGEVIYAVNYNIKEVVGSSTADGVIDEYDAQRMFPQGHGDAYGHYLTALGGYYRLLSNTNFTWTPRAEAVTVLGQPVTVDFQDERKFAAAAGNIARTAQQVVALTYRQNYNDDPAAGWGHYRDSKGLNTSTGVTSRQGLDEWVSRSAQGSLYHWAVANALVPDVDPYHTGVQKIDRTTVPELPELVAAAASFQSTIDNANARLNPLGLSPGAIAFDISPADMAAGKSHFEQIYDRALRSLVNAAGAFNQAAKMTRSLRYQQNQIDDYNTVIAQQEVAYVNQLIDIYGRPYSGEMGAGKLYAQGYDGPDLLHWYIVDRPNDLVDTSQKSTITIQEANQVNYFTGNSLADVVNGFNSGTAVTAKSVTVAPSQWVQYNDVWKTGGLGTRAETGELQDALQDAQQSWLALSAANVRFKTEAAQMQHFIVVFNDMVASHKAQLAKTGATNDAILALEGVALALRTQAAAHELLGSGIQDSGEAIAEFFPKLFGFSNDATAPARGVVMLTTLVAGGVVRALGVVSEAGAGAADIDILDQQQQLDLYLSEAGFTIEEKQAVYEFGILYRQVTTHANELMQITISHQRALQNVNNVLAKGLRILEQREVFRQRAAAIIQGYRTKDLTFRIFRNEALEQYRSLFDLASRYTYLAAKSYDYETGLLGTIAGQTVFSDIVAARSLGDVTAGTPLSTVSSLGDDGLAGVMARLNADFSVVEGRLGINNPDQNGTAFSLRGELFRILRDDTITSDEDAWRQTLEQHIVSNVMSDADVATFCMNIRKPDGTPVPGIIIPFSSSILHGKNFFGLDTAAGDHNFSPSTFATKIFSVGIALPGYVGMDAYAAGVSYPYGAPTTTATNALNATPYCYLIPCGADYMRAPALGDTNVIRSWTVHDQALPLPFNLGATDFNSTQFFNANGTLSEQPWIIRKHQAFRPVDDPTFFYGSVPQEFTNSRLIGRSVWNGQWKIVIPAYTLLSDEQEGLNRFAASVEDVLLFLRTYSHSGN